MYQKVDTNLNFVQREKKTKKFWDAEHIFEKSMKEREGSPMYTFYDGPLRPTESPTSAMS